MTVQVKSPSCFPLLKRLHPPKQVQTHLSFSKSVSEAGQSIGTSLRPGNTVKNKMGTCPYFPGAYNDNRQMGVYMLVVTEDAGEQWGVGGRGMLGHGSLYLLNEVC